MLSLVSTAHQREEKKGQSGEHCGSGGPSEHADGKRTTCGVIDSLSDYLCAHDGRGLCVCAYVSTGN